MEIFPGLVKRIKQKELLRRAHLLNGKLLSEELLNTIKPTNEEFLGINGLVSSMCQQWEAASSMDRPRFTIVRLQGSSDVVTPAATADSSVRMVMGSLDNIHTPSVGATVEIPDPPTILIGVYKGEENKDDVVLSVLVEEMKKISPASIVDDENRQVFVEFSHWVADAPERCALCGTLGHAGHASCPRCVLKASIVQTQWQKDKDGYDESKRNFPYFTSLGAPPRRDEDWESFLEISEQGEVCLNECFIQNVGLYII